MIQPDYTVIRPYQQGKITKEEAAKRLCCTVDYVDEFIRYLSEDVNDVEYALREEERRYGSSFVSGQEEMVDAEFKDGCGIPSQYYGRR